jgi:hypothetical protein
MPPIPCRTPSDLLRLLAVPGTDRTPRLIVTETASGEPYAGWLEDAAGAVVGRLDRFRFEFVDYAPVDAPERAAAMAGPVEVLRPASTTVLPDDPRLVWNRPPALVAGHLHGYVGDGADCHFAFASTASQIDVQFHAHAWSGIAEIARDGEPLGEIDLFNAHGPLPRLVAIANPGAGATTITVRATQRKAPQAFAAQMLIEKIVEHDDRRMITPPPRVKAQTHRAGKFADRFCAIVAELPADAVVLDLGGGRRQLGDPRYLNLEYARLTEPDLLGDGLALPFRDATIDFVYCSGVLEHLRDPLRAGAEIRRVLKPGGRVLASAAFFQPVHNEGQHFFNMTPHGIELVFEGLRKVSTWWSNDFGGMIATLVRDTRMARVASADDLATFLALAHKLGKALDYKTGAMCATGVWFEGIRD